MWPSPWLRRRRRVTGPSARARRTPGMSRRRDTRCTMHTHTYHATCFTRPGAALVPPVLQRRPGQRLLHDDDQRCAAAVVHDDAVTGARTWCRWRAGVRSPATVASGAARIAAAGPRRRGQQHQPGFSEGGRGEGTGVRPRNGDNGSRRGGDLVARITRRRVNETRRKFRIRTYDGNAYA